MRLLLIILGFLVLLSDGRSIHYIGTNSLIFQDGYVFFIRSWQNDMEIRGQVDVGLIKGIVHIQDTEL